MRYQVLIKSMVILIIILIHPLSHAEETTSNQSTNKLTTHHTPKAQTAHSTETTNDFFSIQHFDIKNIYAVLTPIYGNMSGGGLSSTPFAQTIGGPLESSGDVNGYIPKIGSNWGYQVMLGYKQEPQLKHAIAAIYSYLSTSGIKNASIGAGGKLYNELTQTGISATPDVSAGFSQFWGPALAIARTNYSLENLEFIALYPMSTFTEKGLTFSKSIGLRGVHLIKHLEAQYEGLVDQWQGFTVPGQDTVNYSSYYYGIGPEAGLWSIIQLHPAIALKGGGTIAFVAGFFKSMLNEQASATEKIPTAGGEFASYNVQESHSAQPWTPLIANAEVSLAIDPVHNPHKNYQLSLEGGFSTGYILATFGNDTYTQTIGNALPKLNNNLSIIYTFARVNINLG